MADDGVPVDLRADGLLWLINHEVFHPRGYALAVELRGDEVVGFRLMGDGGEPWAFAEGVADGKPEAAEAAMRRSREAS